jgi:TRAP-type C4-dicarboxylate transport system permease small subunit
MIYGGISITKLSMTQKTASLGIPMGYIYLVIPVTGIIIAVYGILNVIDLTGKGENV